MKHLFDTLSYEVDGKMYIHDDFGNLVPMSWKSGILLILFLISDTDNTH